MHGNFIWIVREHQNCQRSDVQKKCNKFSDKNLSYRNRITIAVKNRNMENSYRRASALKRGPESDHDSGIAVPCGVQRCNQNCVKQKLGYNGIID